MIARNFYQGEFSLLYPKIDMAGALSGIIGSEFPLFNALIYLCFEIFGFEHWYGRLINLIISSIGIYFFFKVLKELFTSRIAYYSTIILLCSIWFSFSRKIMPDTFSVSLVIISLSSLIQYIRESSISNLVYFIILGSLGCLSKIPAISLLSPLIIIFFIPSINRKKRTFISFAVLIVAFITALWYFYWVPHLTSTYQYELYFPKTLADGFLELKNHIPDLFKRFYFSAFLSYIAFVSFIIGAIFLVKDKMYYALSGLLAAFIIFGVFIIKTGAVFPTHNYYIIPFVPFMAFTAGYSVSKISNKWAAVVCTLIFVEAIANQQHDFFIKDENRYKLKLEKIGQNTIDDKELIVINGGKSPQLIYFINKKGWSVSNKFLEDPTKIDSLKSLGAQKLIIDKKTSTMNYPFKKAYNGEHFEVYDLLEPQEL
ncbi:glycosyltransferase family 39 protein [Salibacter sp.]|uniref:ArnT family glycosyltransferase n=1 Tax=Salibacter sp. TaxID=2010995 RepID=UPI002870875C|nr:glycosyltransferase family 39 protein [Salibacter sp.]MDR9398141.1 glycosyltransferase family 39 protein [Salibacter sp.]MDR9487545.1 glycosyltransferase family 39 protein [Salibacter sp.]